MKKRTKTRLKLLLWLLVAVAIVSLLVAPIARPVPKMTWRAPVQLNLPPLPKMPKIPDMPSLSAWSGGGAVSRPEQAASPSPPILYEEKIKTEDKQLLVPGGQGKGQIAVIIDDVGLVHSLSSRAIKLPAFVTLSFLPYASELQAQADVARQAGHTLMLHLPMEPLGRESPGPNALLTQQDQAEWARRLDLALNSFTGFSGVNNHMGSKFTMDAKGMTFVANVLREKGLFFVDSRTSGKSIAEEVMRRSGVPTVKRDVFLDDDPAMVAVRSELARAEQVARRKGQAVVIGHPHAVTLEALEDWIPDAQARGFQLIPVQELVK